MIATMTINSQTIGNGTDITILDARGFSSPNVEHSLYRRPGTHGSKLPDTFWRERVIRLELLLRKSTQSAYQTLREDILKAFGLARIGNSTLKFTTVTGQNLQMIVQLNGPIEAYFEKGRLTSGIMRIELVAPDPYLVSQSQISSNLYLPVPGGVTLPTAIPLSFASSGGTVTINNTGNGVHKPQVIIYGPCTNPHVRNNTQGIQLTIDETLTTNQYAIVDLDAETALLYPGGSNILSSLSGDWWSLDPGNNVISYTGDVYSADSYAEILWRSSWLGL